MNKVPARPKINKLTKQVPGTINKFKKYNTIWSHLGGDLGGAQKCSRVSGAQTMLRLINTLYVQLITFWGVSFWEKMDDPQDDPQNGAAGISRRINKVLAIMLSMFGHFDSKWIVKKVVWRKKQNKGGGVY